MPRKGDKRELGAPRGSRMRMGASLFEPFSLDQLGEVSLDRDLSTERRELTSSRERSMSILSSMLYRQDGNVWDEK